MPEKFTPAIIDLPKRLAGDLESRLPTGTHLSEKCIVYPPGSEEIAKIHPQFISRKLVALNTLNGQVPIVYFNTLNNGNIIIFYEATTSPQIPDAVILANLELKRKNLLLIPEFANK